MSRSRKKFLPATGPQNITTRPAPRSDALAPAPDVSRRGAGLPNPGDQGGVPWWAVAAVVLVVALVGALLLVRDDTVPPKGGPPPRVETKGKPWEQVLAEMARGGQLGQKKPWVPEKWAPASAADQLIDRFVTLKKAGDPRANDLLGGKALAEEEVLAEADLEPRATDTYLRGPFRIDAIYRGEPDGQGGQRPAPNRYTLAGQGPVQTPPIRLRDPKGEALLSRAFITRQGELVVEVRDGKIFGLRSTSGR